MECRSVQFSRTLGLHNATLLPNTDVALTVAVVAPNGGETWQRGTLQTVSWSVTGDISQIADFLVSYSVDGGATYPNDVGIVLGTSRSTSWAPPLTISNSAAGRIRVQARSANGAVVAQDISDSNFNFGSLPATGIEVRSNHVSCAAYSVLRPAYAGPMGSNTGVAELHRE